MLVTNTQQVALEIHELDEDELANESRTPDISLSIHCGSQFFLQAIIICAQPLMFITYNSVFPM